MRTFFTLMAVACSFAAFAQGHVKITGTVNDSTSNAPVEFATVALVETASGKAVDGAICDDKGKFTINKVAEGSYRVTITFIGFETKTIDIQADKKDIDLGTITISPTQQVLKEVTIEGERAIIEERVDRTIYNAENDATAKGGDATDVLKRVPLLSVDLDGNVSLRGNQNITVLINNKPSTIVASSVADALKQIPADQIKTVEVITSPSAKYDAEGSAGIINIVTKKNNLQGLTLGIDAGAGLRGSNLGLNGNFRKGKMGFSLGGWGRSNYNVRGSFNNTQVIHDIDVTTGLPTGSGDVTNVQTADTRNQGLFGHYNLGWDYDINEKNSLAASVRFGVRNGRNVQDDLQQFTNDELRTIQDILSRDQSNNVDASLTYTRLYAKPQRELSFQGLYSRNNRDNIFENFSRDPADFSSTLSRFKNLNESFNEEITLQGDYQTPITSMQMVEFGGKHIMRKAVSDFMTFNATGSDGPYVQSATGSLSNNLNYDQNVTAGYLSYTLSTKAGYSFKAGSRYEYTTINAYTKTDNDITIPSYGVIVPSVNVSKKLKGGNMVKASYNRRIQRPSIRFLNPNIQQNNPLNVTIGNPELQPEYTNNYELSWSTFVKGTTINLSGFVRNTNDAIQSVRDIIGNDKSDADTIRTRYQNIGSENAYGASIFANVNIGKLTLNGGGDVYYATLDNGNDYWVYQAKNEGWVASGRIFGNYNLGKEWGLQFFSFIRGRQVQLQGSQGGFYMYSLAVRKQFNEKRGSVGLGIENFVQESIKIRTNLESPLVTQRSVNEMFNMSFRVNFSYRIGKMTMEDRPRRSRRSINNDDLKEGGDGGNDGGGAGMNGGEGGRQGGGGMPNMGGGGRPGGNQRPGGAPAGNPVQQQKTITAPADGIVYEAAGTWTFTIDSPQGGGGTLVLKKEDGVYSGTIKTDRMREETPLTSVKVNGNNVIVSYTVNFGGNSVPVEINTNIKDADMNGTMAFGQFRSFNLTGKKSQ